MTANSTPSQAAVNHRTRNAWFILAILLLFSIAAPLNQNKVPPILPVLLKEFNLTVGQGGLLMSVYAITGILLAIPAGFIYQKLGQNATGLIAGGSIFVGVVLGAVSKSMEVLLVSRVIEGIGTSFMAVLAPSIIATAFPVNKRGTAMGVWGAWFPIGSIFMMLLAPSLVQVSGWQSVWWFGGGYALVVTVLFLVFVKPAKNIMGENGSPAARLPDLDARKVFQNRNVWLLGLTFFFYCTASMSFGAFTPTFLNLKKGLSLSQASILLSISSFMSIFAGPLGGFISDRIGSRKKVFLTSLFVMAVLIPLTSILPTNLFAFQVVIQGLIGGMAPANVFSAAVEAAGDERLGGLAMGVIILGQNAGMLVGPALFGILVESAGGWGMAYASLGILCLLGILAGIMTTIPTRQLVSKI